MNRQKPSKTAEKSPNCSGLSALSRCVFFFTTVACWRPDPKLKIRKPRAQKKKNKNEAAVPSVQFQCVIGAQTCNLLLRENKRRTDSAIVRKSGDYKSV